MKKIKIMRRERPSSRLVIYDNYSASFSGDNFLSSISPATATGNLIMILTTI
jgi:hypothetical protein